MNWRNVPLIRWTISAIDLYKHLKIFWGVMNGIRNHDFCTDNAEVIYETIAEILHQVWASFLQLSLNHTSQTFLSCAKPRWWGDWTEWVSPVLLLATSDFLGISHLTPNLSRECCSRTFTLFSNAIPWVRKSVAISQTMHGLLWEDLRGE